MFQIVIQATPTENSELFGECLGAFAAVFIDFADLDGAFILAQYYVEQAGWKIITVDQEYYVIDSVDDLAEEYHQYYQETKENGYSIVFNIYETEEE